VFLIHPINKKINTWQQKRGQGRALPCFILGFVKLKLAYFSKLGYNAK
jgi:hypothetical protein